jgi:hypothetical protein
MRKLVYVLMTGLGLLMANEVARADFGFCGQGCGNTGYSPKWAFWARSNKVGYYCSEEEERWQKFWHDYYRALHCFYKKLDKCDWVIYYKYHGYQIGGGQPQPAQCAPQYAPVYVTPTMHWATPGSGAPCYAPNAGWGSRVGCSTCR